MPDAADEAAKAERLAAAKKRVELLKKSKGKKKGAKPAEAASSEVKADDKPAAQDPTDQAGGESPVGSPPVEDPAEEEPTGEKPTSPDEISRQLSPPPPSTAAAAQSRAASIHARRASASGFRRPSISAADLLRSPNRSPLSPVDVPEIYRKQAGIISELTEAVERLEAEVEKLRQKEKRLGEAVVEKEDAEEQLTGVKTALKEAIEKADIAAKEKKEREDEVEKLKSELASITRQSSHLTSQISQKDKAISDLKLRSSNSSSTQDQESLTAKENQIENMEMEISKLRGDLERATKFVSETQAKLSEAEEKVKSLGKENEQVRANFDETKTKLDKSVERLVSKGAVLSSAETLVKSLTLELQGAKDKIKAQESTISLWEKDYNTLKTMYRETDTKSQESTKKAAHLAHENKTLQAQLLALEKNPRGGAGRDDDDVDELEDAERQKLQSRVRALETQLFNERKQRHALEKTKLTESSPPSSSSANHPSYVRQNATFDEVDLNTEEHMLREQQADFNALEKSRLQMERIERVKAVKRGLIQWKGWKMDLTAVGSNSAYGDAFDV